MSRWIVAVLVLAAIAASPAAGASEQTPRAGGTVVAGPLQEPACLNPLVGGCVNNTFFWITEKVLAPSFTTAPDFTHKPILVSRVAFTTKAPFTLTYKIRPEARWSDGVPVTAQDYVFTHRAGCRKRPPGHRATIHQQVLSVRPVGAKTVRVVLRSRVAEWRTLFAFVLPRHALAGEDLTKIWGDRMDNPKTGFPSETVPSSSSAGSAGSSSRCAEILATGASTSRISTGWSSAARSRARPRPRFSKRRAGRSAGDSPIASPRSGGPGRESAPDALAG